MRASPASLHPKVTQSEAASTRTESIRKLTPSKCYFLNDQTSHFSGALGVIISPSKIVGLRRSDLGICHM